MALRNTLHLVTFKSLHPGGKPQSRRERSEERSDLYQSMTLLTFKDYINQFLLGRLIGSQFGTPFFYLCFVMTDLLVGGLP